MVRAKGALVEGPLQALCASELPCDMAVCFVIFIYCSELLLNYCNNYCI